MPPANSWRRPRTELPIGARRARREIGHHECVVQRQLTAFLPSPIGERVDEIRARWDPGMADHIPAHITVLHDAPDDHALRSGLDLVAAGPQLLVRLTDARCWGAPDNGIYLGVEDTRGDINRIRGLLRVVDPPGVRYEPHVTLVHSRTVAASGAQAAWRVLTNWAVEAVVVINRLCVIELHGSQWQVVTQLSLACD